MIYLTTGVKERLYTALSGDEWQHLLAFTREQFQQIFALDNTRAQTYKLNSAPYVVYGQSTSLERGDSQIIERSILFIDVDDTGDYQVTSQDITRFMNNLNYNYLIYPTINNGIKSGARLRVAVPLDEPLNQADYIKVWRVLTNHFHVKADPAGAERSFKQLQGLYVHTQQNDSNKPMSVTDGTHLPAKLFVQVFDENAEEYKEVRPSLASRQKGINNANSNRSAPWHIKAQQILTTILDPEGHYMEFGGWDNMLTSIGGWIYERTGGSLPLVAEYIETINGMGRDPINDKELQRKFRNWAKYWR